MDTSDKLVIHETLTELESFDSSKFSSNRDQHIDEMLLAKQLFRRSSISIDNNCLLDTIFQQISTSITYPNFGDFVLFIRKAINQTGNEQLNINDKVQGVQILKAVQEYLLIKAGLQYHFDLTVFVADNEGNIDPVEMQPITSELQSDGEAISIRMVFVNYNHYQPLFKRLRSLEENPLKEFKQLGRRFCASEDFCTRYPEWQEVLCYGYSANDRVGESYHDSLERSRKRLAFPGAEEDDGQSSQHLMKIKAAVRAIVKELSKESPDSKQYEPSVYSIRDHAYELLIDPEKKVHAYIQNPLCIYIQNKDNLQEKLQQITGGNSSKEVLSERILEAMSLGNIPEGKEKLLKDYPRETELICCLAETAEQLLSKAREAALKEIQDYQERKDVKDCYVWFLKDLYLLCKFWMLTQGKYASRADYPRGTLFNGKIYYPSYIPQLSALVDACQSLQKGDLNKKDFEEYLFPRKCQHLQEKITSPSFFLEVVNAILLWPKIYEPSDGEWEFLFKVISNLTVIANKNFSEDICIPYNHLSISKNEVDESEKAILKEASSTEKKREACRNLYHSRIPWKALRAIGNLTITAGGVSKQEKMSNDRLLRTAIVDFVRDLPQVKKAMCALIDFELSEFDSEPSIIPPQGSPSPYLGIHLLGDFVECRVHFKECLETLGHWKNQSLKDDDFSKPKIQFAILRTIQLLGEITKNIRDTGVLGTDHIWKCFEKIRDVLSHSERIQTEKRLNNLLKDPKNGFEKMLDDLKKIRDFIENRSVLLNACRSWDERLIYFHSGAEQKNFLKLPGLEDLFIFLTKNCKEKEVQGNLLRSLRSDEAKSCRSKIFTIIENFKKEIFVPETYKGLVELLPLAPGQRREVEKVIKLVISRNAEQNAIDAKSSMLKKSVKSINTLLDMKGKKKKEKQKINGKPLKSKTSDTIIKIPKEDLECLKEKLDKCICSIKTKEFDKLAGDAKGHFEILKQEWGKKSSLPGEVDKIANELTNLTESVQQYIKRNKDHLLSILNKISVYGSEVEDFKVEDCGTKLIEQLSRVPLKDLEIQLHELGITGGAKDVWFTARQCGSVKGKMCADEGERDEVEQIQRLIEKVENRIKRLYELMIHQNSESILDDPLLLLACLYLLSDFRSAASNLEGSLELMKYTIDSCHRQFITDIQCDLIYFKESANSIVHLHDISEPGTITPYGKKVKTLQEINKLICDFSPGSDESLFSKLQILKEIFGT